ncbi:hypothetical protein MFLAVUS_003360 [Mucor flavus]|uniref:Uncharacterized protein n=1 Tax=Mucor flavus TaxID=439312 RepID=A0ABP9YSY6_9FUNG
MVLFATKKETPHLLFIARQESTSPPPHRSGRWECRSYSPRPYRRGCSRSPRRYLREHTPIRYRWDHSPSRRGYSRSHSPYQWDYQRSVSPYPWRYTPPPPRRYTRSPSPISGYYYRPSRCDRSHSPYIRRRSFSRSPSPYYRRRTYQPVSPPRGRSPIVRTQREDDSPVYQYQQYIPSYQHDRVPSVHVDSREPLSVIRRDEPSSSSSFSHTDSQSIPYGYTRRLSQQRQQQPEQYRRSSLSPPRKLARVTRSDRSNSQSTLRSGSTEDIFLTPENNIVDSINPSRSPSVQSLIGPLQDGTVYGEEEKNYSKEVYSYSGIVLFIFRVM